MPLAALALFLLTLLLVLAMIVGTIFLVMRAVERRVQNQTEMAVRVLGEVLANTVDKAVGALGQMTVGVVGEVKGGTGEVPDSGETEAERPPYELWGVHDEDYADPTDGLLADPPPFASADRTAVVAPGSVSIPGTTY